MAWGYPQGGPKIEFGTKLAQDAAKSGFKEALEASWGRLGRPKREPREAKIEVGRMFFSKLKRHGYNKLVLNAFFVGLGPPWGTKNEHFVWEGLQK